MKQYRLITVAALVVLGLSVMLAPQSARAFSFSPIVIEFAPSGPEATQTMSAENKGSEKIAIQVSAFTRAIDESGKEELTPSEHFKIFPEQFVLQPGQSRAVRVTYRGPSTLKAETAYRFVAEQLPVDMQKKANERASGGRLNFLIRYETSVYVRPTGTRPDVKIEQVTALPKTGEPKELELILKNDGTAHQLLGDLKVAISSKNGSMSLSKEQLKALEKQNLLAGARRKIVVPWEGKAIQGPLSASVTVAP